MGLLDLGILSSNVSYCSLHLLLHIFDLFGGLDQLESGSEDLLVLFVSLASFHFLIKALLLRLFIINKRLHMLSKFTISIESLINVVSWLEVLEPTKHGLTKGDISTIDIVLIGWFAKHSVNLIEP